MIERDENRKIYRQIVRKVEKKILIDSEKVRQIYRGRQIDGWMDTQIDR